MQRNPNQGYDPVEVPPCGETRSRYAVDQTPGGVNVAKTADAISAAYDQLLEERIQSAPEALPERKRVSLKAVVRVGDDYQAVPRGVFSAIPTRVATRSGRFTRPPASAGALVDLVVRGEVNVRDDVCWDALVELAHEERPTGETLRKLSDTVALSLLLSAGIAATRSELPTEHLNVDRSAA